jgi:cytoskeleton protein RodZ
MESVGQKLREARLRKGLGLEDVSAETRINLKNLQAIESDMMGLVPSRFLYRSFVRQFAGAVGLDWTGIEGVVNAAVEAIPAPLLPGEGGTAIVASVPGLKPRRAHKLRWAVSMASLVVMLGACSSFYGAWERARTDIPGSISAWMGSFKVHAGSKQAANKVRATTAAQVTKPAQPAPVQPANGFQIQLSAVENCWLSVVTDGHEVFSGVLQPSEKKTLAGQEEARVLAGNAGGVEINFNGKALGTLGRRGEVRTVVFTKNGYEVLQREARAEYSATQGGE